MKTTLWTLMMFSAMHHAIASLYDVNKVESHKGVIVAMAWINPHNLLFVDTTSADGAPEHWAIELPPSQQLAARSFSKDVFVPGDSVEFCGHITLAGVDPLKSFQAPEPISLSLKSIPRPVYSGKLFYPLKLVLKQGRDVITSNDARCVAK